MAIVTGGSRGLGQEMAEGLAEAGASLMLCARREEWLTPTVDADARAAASGSKACSATWRKPADVQAVVDRTIATFGKVDILVNNAGVTWAAEPEDMPLEQVAEGRRHQPHRRVSVRAGGGPRHADAAVGPHHQHRVDRRHARVGAGTALRGVRGDQGGPDRADARARGVVGRAKASASTRSRRASSIRGSPTARSR